MENAKTSLSQSASYEELGDFWDNHGLDEVWKETHGVSALVELSANKFLEVSPPLQQQLYLVAARQGIGAQELLNRWLKERLEREAA